MNLVSLRLEPHVSTPCQCPIHVILANRRYWYVCLAWQSALTFKRVMTFQLANQNKAMQIIT